MTGAVRHTKSIFAAEAMAQALFSDCEIQGDNWPVRIANLQKEFIALLRLTLRKFESLKDDLDCWRQKVSSGELDFDSAPEDDFRAALRAFVSLSGFLGEKFKEFHEKNIYLAKPMRMGLLQTYTKEAQKILDSWQSPEWEVTDMRTVKWGKEQTRYLRTRLGSCK